MKRFLGFVLFAVNVSWAQDAIRPSGWVVIPVSEYGALRARAFPAAREPEPPPVDATLTRVEYDLRIIGDLAAGRASLTVDVLKDGWVRVPIPAGLMVSEARLEGKLVSLVRAADGKGAGQLTAVLSKPGRAVLVLDVAMPVTAAGGEQRLPLPASPSGVTRATVALARNDVDLKVTGGLLAETMEGEGEVRWLAYARGSEPLTLVWRRKVEDHRPVLPLRFRGSLTELIGLGEDSSSVYVEVTIDVTQGAARQVKVQVPPAVTVNQVAGANVADWEAKPGELTVTLLEPVEHSATFVIHGETRLAREGSLEIPLLRLLEGERDTGGVAVEVLGAGEIRNLKSQGLERAEASDLGRAVAARLSPSLAAFRFRPAPARTLTVDVTRYTQQAVLTANVEEARYRVLMSGDGKTLVEARYAVRNNQRNFVRITLPQGATVWSSSLSGQAVRPGTGPGGSLLFPLAKARAGEDAPVFAIEIVYLIRNPAWSEKGRATLALPALDLPVARTGVALHYPPLFRVTPEAGTFRAQAFERPASAALLVEAAPAAAPGVPIGPDPVAQALVDRYRARAGARTPVAAIGMRIPFPAVGPSVFLVSELTAENRDPHIELSYQKDRKGGAR